MEVSGRSIQVVVKAGFTVSVSGSGPFPGLTTAVKKCITR